VIVVSQSLQLPTVSWMSEEIDDELTDDVAVSGLQQLRISISSSDDVVDDDDCRGSGGRAAALDIDVRCSSPALAPRCTLRRYLARAFWNQTFIDQRHHH